MAIKNPFLPGNSGGSNFLQPLDDLPLFAFLQTGEGAVDPFNDNPDPIGGGGGGGSGGGGGGGGTQPPSGNPFPFTFPAFSLASSLSPLAQQHPHPRFAQRLNQLVGQLFQRAQGGDKAAIKFFRNNFQNGTNRVVGDESFLRRLMQLMPADDVQTFIGNFLSLIPQGGGGSGGNEGGSGGGSGEGGLGDFFGDGGVSDERAFNPDDFLDEIRDTTKVENPFLQELTNEIRAILQGDFGLPDDILREHRNAINRRGLQREQQALDAIESRLNTSGQLGGGQFTNLAREAQTSVSQATANALEALAAEDARFANQGRQQALQAALGAASLGNQLALGQGELSLQGLLGGQGLNLEQFLGLEELSLRELLGRGDLGLRSRALDLQELGILGDLQFREFLTNLFLSGGIGGI